MEEWERKEAELRKSLGEEPQKDVYNPFMTMGERFSTVFQGVPMPQKRNAIIESLEAPGKMFHEGVDKLSSNPVAGAIQMGHGLLTAGFLPFSTGFAAVEEGARAIGQDHFADVIEGTFSLPAQGFQKGRQVIDDILGEKIVNITDTIIAMQMLKAGVTPEQLKDVHTQVQGVGETFSTLLALGAFGKGFSAVKTKGFKIPKNIKQIRDTGALRRTLPIKTKEGIKYRIEPINTPRGVRFRDIFTKKFVAKPQEKPQTVIEGAEPTAIETAKPRPLEGKSRIIDLKGEGLKTEGILTEPTIKIQHYATQKYRKEHKGSTSFFRTDKIERGKSSTGQPIETPNTWVKSAKEIVEAEIPANKIYQAGAINPKTSTFTGKNPKLDALIDKSPDFQFDTRGAISRWTKNDRQIAIELKKEGYLGFQYPKGSQRANEIVILNRNSIEPHIKPAFQKQSTMLESIQGKDKFTVKELAKDSGQDIFKINNFLKDLTNRRLMTVRTNPKGGKEYIPTDEFRTLIEDMIDHPTKYDIKGLDKLSSNPVGEIMKGVGRAVTFLDDMWKKYAGDKLYKIIGKVEKILPKSMIENYGLPTEYLDFKRDAFDAIHRYNKLASSLANDLLYGKGKTKFTLGQQKRLAQIIRSGVTTDKFLGERAGRARKELKQIGEIAKDLGVLPLETYNVKLPRKEIFKKLEDKRQAQLELNELQIGREIGEEWGMKGATRFKIQEKQKEIADIERSIKTSYKHGGEGYFKRVYGSKEQHKKWNKYGVHPTRLDLTSAIQRQDIPWKVRREMGEVLTASYPVAKAIMLEGKDVSLANFFNLISERGDWVSAVERPDFVKMGDSPRLGALKERYVERNIANDINDVMKFTEPETMRATLENINAVWKMTKTAMNPATHMRNIMSNTILADLGGLSHIDQIRLLPTTIQALKGKGEYAKKLEASNLARTTFERAELGKYLDVLSSEGGGVKGFLRLPAGNMITKLYGKMSLVDTKLGKTMGKVYQFEEVFMKSMKFISELEKGRSIKEARREAEKWLFDYTSVPKMVERLRKNPFYGVPFITWSYKAFPRIIEAAVTRPIAFWKYPVIFSALAKYSMDQLNITDEEMTELQKVLPDRVQKGQWLLLPTRDANGKAQLLDLTYILPYKDVYDVFQSGYTIGKEILKGDIGKTNEGENVVTGLLGFIQAPITKTVIELSTGLNTYNHSKIWTDADTGKEVVQKALDHAYKTFMPALAPEIPGLSKGGYAYHKLVSVVLGREDYYDRTFALAPAIGSSLLGLKTTPIEYEKFAEKKIRKLDNQLRDIGSKVNRILRDNSLDDKEKVQKSWSLYQRMENIRSEKENIIAPVKSDAIRKKELALRTYQRLLSKIPLSKKGSRASMQLRVIKAKMDLFQLENKK